MKRKHSHEPQTGSVTVVRGRYDKTVGAQRLEIVALRRNGKRKGIMPPFILRQKENKSVTQSVIRLSLLAQWGSEVKRTGGRDAVMQSQVVLQSTK